MINLSAGVVLAIIGVLALVALGRSLLSGAIPIFFTSRPDIVRAEEPLRFWTQFVGVLVAGVVALFIASILLFPGAG
jgi:hypothetical protein